MTVPGRTAVCANKRDQRGIQQTLELFALGQPGSASSQPTMLAERIEVWSRRPRASASGGLSSDEGNDPLLNA
jgi:hypothetical protein